MAHFMVDLENTNSSGLVGARYLESTDCVSIFYSKSCSKVEQGLLRYIFDSGCLVETCKLFKTGPNALDFYIASRIGFLFGSGYTGRVAIITEDKGLMAINHYWQQCVTPHRQVVLKPNIEQAILALGEENSPRIARIKENLEMVSLEKALSDYKASQDIRTVLGTLFKGTEQERRLTEIMDIIASPKVSNKVLYLAMLKRFGRKDGLEIYRKLRLLEQKGLEVL